MRARIGRARRPEGPAPSGPHLPPGVRPFLRCDAERPARRRTSRSTTPTISSGSSAAARSRTEVGPQAGRPARRPGAIRAKSRIEAPMTCPPQPPRTTRRSSPTSTALRAPSGPTGRWTSTTCSCHRRAARTTRRSAPSWQTRFRHVLVDEYQDTNHVQYRLLRGAVRAPRQRVRGRRRRPGHLPLPRRRRAQHPRLLARLPDARVIKLEQNYRSTHDPAGGQRGGRQQLDREPKTLWTANEDGSRSRCSAAAMSATRPLVVVDADAARDRIARRDIALLYRTHAQAARSRTAALRSVPYVVGGGPRFYDRRRGQRPALLLARRAQPGGRREPRADHQRPAARHRPRSIASSMPSPRRRASWRSAAAPRQIRCQPAARKSLEQPRSHRTAARRTGRRAGADGLRGARPAPATRGAQGRRHHRGGRAAREPPGVVGRWSSSRRREGRPLGGVPGGRRPADRRRPGRRGRRGHADDGPRGQGARVPGRDLRASRRGSSRTCLSPTTRTTSRRSGASPTWRSPAPGGGFS